MKTINIELSKKSIQAAIREIEAYKRSIDQKTKLFIEKMAEAGYNVADATLMAVSEEEKGSTVIQSPQWESDNCMVIKMSGDKFLFVEFGAGIAFSNPQNPKAQDMGMGLGTYPGQTHAYQEEGWWYREDGVLKKSRGNAPYMPMYKAGVEIRRQVENIAREVFGS